MVVFKSDLFRFFLLFSLVILLIYNSYNLYLGDKFAIAPIFFQMALIILILRKDKIVKGFLKIWSGLFMILFPGLQVLAQLLYYLLDGLDAMDVNKLTRTLLFTILGCCIYYFTEKTIEVRKSDG